MKCRFSNHDTGVTPSCGWTAIHDYWWLWFGSIDLFGFNALRRKLTEGQK